MKYRLAAEYECHPIWVFCGDVYKNTPPSDLPVSPKLAGRIAAWNSTYQATYRPEDPASSGFLSTDAELQFESEGRALAHRLNRELCLDSEVSCFGVISGWEMMP